MWTLGIIEVVSSLPKARLPAAPVPNPLVSGTRTHRHRYDMLHRALAIAVMNLPRSNGWRLAVEAAWAGICTGPVDVSCPARRSACSGDRSLSAERRAFTGLRFQTFYGATAADLRKPWLPIQSMQRAVQVEQRWSSLRTPKSWAAPE